MKVTSEKLQETQNVLEQLIKNEIDSPMTNHTKVSRLLKVTKEVDLLRRNTWHDEKFGVYEEIADEALSIFNSDDIPF